MVYGVQRLFQQYFSYIVEVSFIGGGSRRKPPTQYFDSKRNALYIILEACGFSG
jgi:hypothetical protein